MCRKYEMYVKSWENNIDNDGWFNKKSKWETENELWNINNWN